MPRGPVDGVEDDELEREAKPARLDRAHCGVLVGDVVILAQPQLRHPGGVIGVLDDRIAQLAPPQFDQESDRQDHGERDGHERKHDQADGRDEDRRQKMDEIANAPVAGRRRDRGQRRLRTDRVAQLVEHSLGVACRYPWQSLAQKFAQPRFLANLDDSPPEPVDIRGRGRDAMVGQPASKIGVRVEVRAETEDLPQARTLFRHSRQQRRRVAVAVDHHAEIGRLGTREVWIRRTIAERVVLENDEPREVDRIECAERDERVRRIGGAGKAGQSHRRQQRAQTLDPVLVDLGDDDEIVLRDHCWPPGPAQALRKGPVMRMLPSFGSRARNR